MSVRLHPGSMEQLRQLVKLHGVTALIKALREIEREADDRFTLLSEIAAMTIDGDYVNGQEYVADGNDEEVDRLYAFVHRARALLGHDDPKGLDHLLDEAKQLADDAEAAAPRAALDMLDASQRLIDAYNAAVEKNNG